MAILTDAPKIAMVADGVQDVETIRANEEILLELFPDQTTGGESELPATQGHRHKEEGQFPARQNPVYAWCPGRHFHKITKTLTFI